MLLKKLDFGRVHRSRAFPSHQDITCVRLVMGALASLPHAGRAQDSGAGNSDAFAAIRIPIAAIASCRAEADRASAAEPQMSRS